MKLTTAFFVLSLTSGISSHVEAADGATMESNKATVAAAARKEKKKQSGLRLAADATTSRELKKKKRGETAAPSIQPSSSNAPSLSHVPSSSASPSSSPSSSPTTTPRDKCNGMDLDITMNVDRWFDESSFSVTNRSGDEVLSVASFPEEGSSNYYVCLPACDKSTFEDSLYTVTVKDSWGDGGLAFSISVDGDVVYEQESNIAYDSQGSVEFSACGYFQIASNLSAADGEEDASARVLTAVSEDNETQLTTSVMLKDNDPEVKDPNQYWLHNALGYLKNGGASGGCLEADKKKGLVVTDCEFDKYDKSKTFIIPHSSRDNNIIIISVSDKKNPKAISVDENEDDIVVEDYFHTQMQKSDHNQWTLLSLLADNFY